MSRKDVTVPNALTLFRILLAIFAAVLFIRGQHCVLAAWMCVGASLLDYFDGWYARRFHQKTRLGAHLDPFADKVLISVIFVTAAAAIESGWFSLFVVLILIRETALTIYRVIRRKRSGTFTPASMLGRLKTFVQCLVGNGLLLYIYVYPAKLPEQSLFLFIIMTVMLSLTLDSGMRYLLPRCSDGKQRSGFERLARWIFRIRAREV
ncbi:MAG: CDP-alcohol phosphatidyltransferase family protein [Candidatus Krumholzibacteria bacterium]|nr:CDP-alcohol phosphatidyltransferase family protein [Candidatus Krumholzibacteria bacterium]